MFKDPDFEEFSECSRSWGSTSVAGAWARGKQRKRPGRGRGAGEGLGGHGKASELCSEHQQMALHSFKHKGNVIYTKILRESLLLLCQVCEYQLHDFDHCCNSPLRRVPGIQKVFPPKMLNGWLHKNGLEQDQSKCRDTSKEATPVTQMKDTGRDWRRREEGSGKEQSEAEETRLKFQLREASVVWPWENRTPQASNSSPVISSQHKNL